MRRKEEKKGGREEGKKEGRSVLKCGVKNNYCLFSRLFNLGKQYQEKIWRVICFLPSSPFPASGMTGTHSQVHHF